MFMSRLFNIRCWYGDMVNTGAQRGSTFTEKRSIRTSANQGSSNNRRSLVIFQARDQGYYLVLQFWLLLNPQRLPIYPVRVASKPVGIWLTHAWEIWRPQSAVGSASRKALMSTLTCQWKDGGRLNPTLKHWELPAPPAWAKGTVHFSHKMYFSP
jgi:hypothetical protein